MLKIKNYVRVQSLEEAYDLCQKKNNVVLGGMLWLKMQRRSIGTAIDLAKRKGQKWWLLLLLSLVSVALGVVLVLHPFDAAIGVTMLCGILLIVEGALNLGCVLYAAMELRTLDRMANAAASAAMSAIGDALDEAEAAECGIPMDGPVVYNAESKDVSEDGE